MINLIYKSDCIVKNLFKNRKNLTEILEKNANTFLEIKKNHSSFERYLRSFRDKTFKWLGPKGAIIILLTTWGDLLPSEAVIK